MNSTLNQFESIGRYKIIRELGQGGMSTVYLAQDTELDREVAIKCVDSKNTATARLAEGLRDEAKLLAKLNYPNIVQLYDVVDQDNTLGLVIEYVGGETLTHRLQQNPSRELRLKWLAEIAEGIASAHTHGIAHCDIKSENILITVNNTAKVADFGIAKLKLGDYLQDDGLTRMESVSGSYFSLSPEQATGQPVDTRTDIFSLALLIYQTLLSKHPFGETSNKIALLQRVINDPFELDQSALELLGVRLAELLKNCLSKSPEDRLYNAKEIAELLKNESLNPQPNDQNDYTVAIPTQQPNPNRLLRFNKAIKTIFPKLAFIMCGVVLGFILLKWFSTTDVVSNDINYIALDNIEVTAPKGFNKDLLALIKSTLQQSAESTILSFRQTGLVDAKELNAISGNFRDKAKAAGVKNILVVAANCLQQKCDIKIQHRSGERMAVSKQTSFPIASESLIDLGNSISSQLPKLFNREVLSFSQREIVISESDYRRYLEIYNSSASGVSVTQKHFDDVETFISERPSFVPAYSLLYVLGGYLQRNTGEKKYLTSILDVLNNVPEGLKKNKIIRKTRISLLLDLGQVRESKQLYVKLQGEVKDKLFLSEIESSIAYAENDYERLLHLDRQNAVWRPSLNNLYNLATSEYSMGNYDKANIAVGRALELSPNDAYALDLKAAIEMSLGNLPLALSLYERLIQNSKDSSVYSNYGLTLALSKKYEQAIDAFKNAIKINPESSLYHLNLADSYALSGNQDLAIKSYNDVLNLLPKPESAQEYSSLSQAYAHLGKHQVAVKKLKVANKKFPNFSELDYAASIVNTISGNYVAAIVDVKDGIESGTAPVWYSLEWFKPLCGYDDFITTTGAATKSLCF